VGVGWLWDGIVSRVLTEKIQLYLMDELLFPLAIFT
jgi:hypothetical protein